MCLASVVISVTLTFKQTHEISYIIISLPTLLVLKLVLSLPRLLSISFPFRFIPPISMYQSWARSFDLSI